MARKSILVVDDDKAITEVFRRILEAFGYEVACCETGKSALNIAKTVSFDAVLADYYLPGTNGADIARTLRAMYPDIVIIEVTERNLEDLAEFIARE